MTQEKQAGPLNDIVLSVENNDSDDSSTDKGEEQTFVFRARGQSEEEPLRLLDVPLKNGGDDHTDETCEVSSRSSSHGESHDEEMGQPAAEQQEGTTQQQWMHDLMWLAICFAGIMASFVAYGIMLEYATSGDRHLHERTSQT